MLGALLFCVLPILLVILVPGMIVVYLYPVDKQTGKATRRGTKI